MISQQVKDKFRKTQESHQKDVMETPLLWKKSKHRRDEFGEDIPAEEYDDISLLCLPNYNYMRTWPITQHTESGELDKQSVQVYLSRKMLKDAGYLNDKGLFVYDPAKDIFIFDGLVWKDSGDTNASALQDNPLLFSLILMRQETPTGTPIR